jgi:hypothetical protein
MEEREEREERTPERETFICPVGRFFSELERCGGRTSAFQEHLKKSRIEFLKAIRSLVEEGIERMEKQGGEKGRKATRIDVE